METTRILVDIIYHVAVLILALIVFHCSAVNIKTNIKIRNQLEEFDKGLEDCNEKQNKNYVEILKVLEEQQIGLNFVRNRLNKIEWQQKSERKGNKQDEQGTM